MSTQPHITVETFENRNPDINYRVRFECPEFTCVCPKTGQPDFATIYIEYVPNKLCVELKSLKLYLWSFRNRGIFHEDGTNEIATHLRDILSPRYLKVVGDFKIRGGIHTEVEVSFGELSTGALNLLA